MDHEKAIVMRVTQQIKKLVKAKVPPRDVSDVVQSALLSCIKAGYLLKPGLKVPRRALVRKITCCRIADYHRDRKHGLVSVVWIRVAPGRIADDHRDRKHLSSSPSDNFDPPASESRDTPERRDENRHIRNVVAGLAKPYRQVVEARYFGDYSDREIAHETGTPVETIRTQRKRAMQMLRHELESSP